MTISNNMTHDCFIRWFVEQLHSVSTAAVINHKLFFALWLVHKRHVLPQMNKKRMFLSSLVPGNQTYCCKKKKVQYTASPHDGSVDRMWKNINTSWAVIGTKCDKILKSLKYSFNHSQRMSKNLLACVAKVHRVDGSAWFPPANQVLRGGSLTGVETLGPWRQGVLGRRWSACLSRLVLWWLGAAAVTHQAPWVARTGGDMKQEKSKASQTLIFM